MIEKITSHGHKAKPVQHDVNEVPKVHHDYQAYQIPQSERGLTGATGMTGAASSVPGPQLEQDLRGFNETDGVNGTQGPPGFTQLIPGTITLVK